MRRFIFSFSFLFVLLLPFIGSYTWLTVQKKTIKKQIKKQIVAGIDESELVHFKFSVSDAENQLRWEHSKEFEFEGEMYDIVRAEVWGDSILYVVWWDKAETKLNRKLAALLDKSMSDTQNNSRNLTAFADFFKLYYFDMDFFSAKNYINYCAEYQLFVPNLYTPINLSPPNPPPNFS